MSWTTQLPVRNGKHVLCVDNNVIGNYFSDREATHAVVNRVFTDPAIQIQCGRQVIDEALNHPGKSVDLRRATWETFARMQARGKVHLSGLATMTPPQRAAYQPVRQALTGQLSAQDAAVAADALVKRVPLLTLESRFPAGLQAIAANLAFQRTLTRLGLPTHFQLVEPQPGARIVSWT